MLLSDEQVLPELQFILDTMIYQRGIRPQTEQDARTMEALKAAIVRYGVCECAVKHYGEFYCSQCGRSVPHADE